MNNFNLPLESLAAYANSYASAKGLLIEKRREGDGKVSSYFECAPVSLLPNIYPKAAFEQAVSLAPAFNALVDRISRNAAFLQDTLGGSVSAADPFTAKLLQLYNEIYIDDNTKSGHAVAADRLGIFRSDYMLHQSQIKQVELNTIAASFAGLASHVAGLHSFLCQRFYADIQDFMTINQKKVVGEIANGREGEIGVPTNPTLRRLPQAMQLTVQRYQDRYQPDNLVILFVVQEGETNTVDQRMLEFALYEAYKIPVERRSLGQIQQQVSLDETTGSLMLNGSKEIALVYYRAGYAPTDYPSETEWLARAKLERGRAAKCPSLGYHLAGTKKVQQQLARPGVLETFCNTEDEALSMRSAFAGLYSLGEDAAQEDLDAVKDILNGAYDKYVLKPQREGGGYNFYGEKLLAKLKENVVENGKLALSEKLGEYILMERLFPPEQKAILLRSGRVEGSGDSVSELGCFGTVIADGEGAIVHNSYGGFLLRTKFSHVDEGGVASGFATLSSPYLCSSKDV